MKTRPYPQEPKIPAPKTHFYTKKAPEGGKAAGTAAKAEERQGEGAASPDRALLERHPKRQRPGAPGRVSAARWPESAAHLREPREGRSRARRPRRLAGVLRDGRKRAAGTQLAGAAGCGGLERAARPRGGTSPAAATAPPLSCAASGSRAAALTCPVFRRRRLLAPVRGQQPRPPRPSSCGAPIPASPGRLPPAPRGVTPASHTQPWPAPQPPPPPPPHRPTEHARAAAVPARAPTSPAGLPAALAPPRAPLGPIPGPAAAAARPAGLAGQGRGRGGAAA